MATTSDRTESVDSGVDRTGSGNRKITLILIAGLIIFLLVFTVIFTGFLSSDSSSGGEGSGSRQEDTRANP